MIESSFVLLLFLSVFYGREMPFLSAALSSGHWLTWTDSLTHLEFGYPLPGAELRLFLPTLGHRVLMTSVIRTDPIQCLEFCFVLFFPSVSDSRKTLFYFDPTIPFLFFLSIFYSYVFRSEGVHQSINFLHAIDLNAFMLKIFGITFVYGVRWTSHACCVFLLSLFKMKLVSPLFSNKW